MKLQKVLIFLWGLVALFGLFNFFDRGSREPEILVIYSAPLAIHLLYLLIFDPKKLKNWSKTEEEQDA